MICELKSEENLRPKELLCRLLLSPRVHAFSIAEHAPKITKNSNLGLLTALNLLAGISRRNLALRQCGSLLSLGSRSVRSWPGIAQ